MKKLSPGNGMVMLDQILKGDAVSDKGKLIEKNMAKDKAKDGIKDDNNTSFKEVFLTALSGTDNDINDIADIDQTEFEDIDIDFDFANFSYEELENILDEMGLDLDELDLGAIEAVLDILGAEHSLQNMNKILEKFLELEDHLDIDLENIFDKNTEMISKQELDKILDELKLEDSQADMEKMFQMFRELEESLDLDNLLLSIRYDQSNDELIESATEELSLDADKVKEILDILDLDHDLGGLQDMLEKLLSKTQHSNTENLDKELNINSDELDKILDVLKLEHSQADMEQMFQMFRELEERLDLDNLALDTDKVKEIFDILDLDHDLGGLQDMLDTFLNHQDTNNLTRLITALEDSNEKLEMLLEQDGEALDVLIGLVLMQNALEGSNDDLNNTKQESNNSHLINMTDKEEIARQVENLRLLLTGESKEETDSKKAPQLEGELNSILDSLQDNAKNAAKNKTKPNSTELNMLYRMIENSKDNEEATPQKILQKLINNSGNASSKQAFDLNYKTSNKYNNLAKLNNHRYDREGKLTNDKLAINENKQSTMDNLNYTRAEAITKGRNFHFGNFSNQFNNTLNVTNNNQESTILNLEDIFNHSELEALRNELNGREHATVNETRNSGLYNREAFVERMAEEIMKFASLRKDKDSFTLNLRLKPERLGNLRLQFTTQDGVMRGEIAAQNQQAREIIQANLSQLREQLEAQGYEFDSLDVATGDDTSFQFENQNDKTDAESKRNNKGKTHKDDKIELIGEEELDLDSEDMTLDAGYSSVDYLV